MTHVIRNYFVIKTQIKLKYEEFNVSAVVYTFTIFTFLLRKVDNSLQNHSEYLYGIFLI